MEDSSKIPASVPFFEVEHVEIFSSSSPIYNIASVKDSYIDLLSSSSRRDEFKYDDELHPIFLISFMFPVGDIFVHFNSYFKRRVPTYHQYKNYLENKKNEKNEYSDSLSLSSLKSFDTLLSRYLNNDDDFKNNRLKLIPRAHDANWIVSKVVGQNPSLLCKSIKSKHYNINENLHVVSLDLDITSSTLASNILSVVKGYAKWLTVDLMFLLQGENLDELSESLIGGVRMINIDLSNLDNFQQNIQRNKQKIQQNSI